MHEIILTRNLHLMRTSLNESKCLYMHYFVYIHPNICIHSNSEIDLSQRLSSGVLWSPLNPGTSFNNVRLSSKRRVRSFLFHPYQGFAIKDAVSIEYFMSPISPGQSIIPSFDDFLIFDPFWAVKLAKLELEGVRKFRIKIRDQT